MSQSQEGNADPTEEVVSAAVAEASQSSGSKTTGAKLSLEQIEQLLATNPTFKKEYGNLSKAEIQKKINEIEISELLKKLDLDRKTIKDMSSHKFWGTQPVIRFDDKPQPEIKEGVIKAIDKDKVSREPRALMEGFEWVIMDLNDEKELNEVQELLSLHYVEDSDAHFRLLYRSSFLNWALKAPGWTKDWHVGVRASKSNKLVAFISAVPCQLRVRQNVVNASEVNFLCVHKKLRGKRLAPVMIEEITRQCYLKGVFQACYTAGTVIPTPISTCRYFHRSLDWKKLFDCGFAHLPLGSTEKRQIAKNKLPEDTQLPGFREMKDSDVSAVGDLLSRYLARFAMAPEFSKEEVKHWLLHDSNTLDRVIWSYVVEEPKSGKITDFVSFYILESSVMGSSKHSSIRAAYLFYHASEFAFDNDQDVFKKRINEVINDALIMARKEKFDVFNALTLLDNPLFLTEQKFQPGDGKLHYYIFNYRTAPLPGGTNEKLELDKTKMGGVGLVML